MNHTEYMRIWRRAHAEELREYWRRLRDRPITPEAIAEASARFWRKTRTEGDCLIYTGQVGRGGYGKFNILARPVSAHRFAYESAVGPIPDGLTLDHLCRNHLCVKPSHLEPVTNRENILRGVSIVAQNARKTHCKNGHPFDRIYGARRGRVCRGCMNEYQNARRAALL